MFCSSVLDDLYKNIHEHKNFWLQDHKLRIDFMEAGLSPDTPLPLDFWSKFGLVISLDLSSLKTLLVYKKN